MTVMGNDLGNASCPHNARSTRMCVSSTEVSHRTNGLSYEFSSFTKCCEEQLRKVCGCRPNVEV